MLGCTLRAHRPSILALALTACGGGAPPVELTIDGAPAIATALGTLVLHGQTFIPDGSQCPPSSEFIVIGSYGPASITTRNAAAGAEGGGVLPTPCVTPDEVPAPP